MLCGLQGNVQNIPFRVCGKHSKGHQKENGKFQHLAQKVQFDDNSDTFAAHFAQHFNQKLTPQQCREITTFGFFYDKPYWFDEDLG